MSETARLSSPSALRNREPILQVLRAHLPGQGTVLEVASGSGEHVTYFAANLPHLQFQPSDPDPAHRASIDAWAAGMANVHPALALDASAPWPELQAEAIVCINMIHIAPWAACEGLIVGAARVLAPGGCLLLYGPYRRGGRHTAAGNAAFDADLRARNPSWGVRDLEAVAALAAAHGFAAPVIVAMPANNHSLILHREG